MSSLHLTPPLFESAILKDAVISPCGLYRYVLIRVWDEARPFVQFICLNPSTANAFDDDRTTDRCIDYARRWERGKFGGAILTNLFAFRSKDPTLLLAARDPIGPDNDYWIKETARDAGLIVAGWGPLGRFMQRGRAVEKMLGGQAPLS